MVIPIPPPRLRKNVEDEAALAILSEGTERKAAMLSEGMARLSPIL